MDVVATADDAEVSKPAPDIFLAAAAKLGIDPLACAAVGDSLHDASGARRAGAAFVGITTGYVERAVCIFCDAGAHIVLPSVIRTHGVRQPCARRILFVRLAYHLR